MPGNFNINRIKSQLQQRDGLSRGLFFECVISLPIPLSGAGSGVNFGQDDTIVCKAVSLPSDTLDIAEIRYFTRSIKIPASRQPSPITLSFYNTVDYQLRKNFYHWINLFNSPITNVRGSMEKDQRKNGVAARVPDKDTQPNKTYQENPLSAYATIELIAYNNTGGLTWSQLKDLAINSAIGIGESAAGRINPIAGSVANQIVNKFDKRQIESNNPISGRFVFYDAFPTSIGGLQFSYDDDTSYQTYDVEFQYRHMTFIPQDELVPETTATLIDGV